MTTNCNSRLTECVCVSYYTHTRCRSNELVFNTATYKAMRVCLFFCNKTRWQSSQISISIKHLIMIVSGEVKERTGKFGQAINEDLPSFIVWW